MSFTEKSAFERWWRNQWSFGCLDIDDPSKTMFGAAKKDVAYIWQEGWKARASLPPQPVEGSHSTYCRFCNGLDGRHYQDCAVTEHQPIAPEPTAEMVVEVEKAIAGHLEVMESSSLRPAPGRKFTPYDAKQLARVAISALYSSNRSGKGVGE